MVARRWGIIADQYATLFLDHDFGDRELTGLTDFVHGRLSQIRPERVLDIGTGTGYLAQWVSKSLPTVRRVVGIDISARMVEIAVASNRSERVSYVRMAAEELRRRRLPVAQSTLIEAAGHSAGVRFDVAVANLSLMDVYDLRAVMAGISRHVKLGGKFILTITNPMAGFLSTASYREEPLGRVGRRPCYSREFWKKGIFLFKGRELPFVYIRHRPLCAYTSAMLASGIVISDICDRFVQPGAFEPVYIYIEGEVQKCT